MLATNPTSRYTLWTRAASWPRFRGGAPAGEPRPGRAVPHRPAFLIGRPRRVHTFASRPFPQCPCLIHSGRAAEVAERAEAAPEVEVEVKPAEGGERAEAARGGGGG